MAETIVLDPSAVATNRTALDITSVIDVEGVDWGDATIEAYMADAERGQLPVDYRVPNRTVTIPLIIKTVGATSFDTFRQQLQAKAALIQREGGWLSRQTSIGTLYMDVVNATLKLGGDWLQANRSVDVNAVLTLECIPDFYGAEITLDDFAETSAAEIVTKLKLSAADAVIKGDYPGRVRIVVDEDQAQSQRGMIWGFRCRHYSSASTAALRYEAEALTPLDSAAIATVTGASGGASNNVIQHALLPIDAWTPVLSTRTLSGSLDLTHTGSYRVWARVYSTNPTAPRVRFAWDVGDLAFPAENAPKTVPGSSSFFDMDLGEVRLDAPPVGTHRWQGIIQASGSMTNANVSIDKVWFQPLDECAGVLRAQGAPAEGVTSFAARDGFNQAAGALTGKTLEVGGTWAGAGDADDFTVDATADTATRSTTADADDSSGRFAIAGTGTLTDAIVGVKLPAAWDSGSGQGVFARYTDVSNYLLCFYRGGLFSVYVQMKIAGATTVLGFPVVADPAGKRLAFTVGSNGAWRVTLDGAFVANGQNAALATGGALASGKVGFYDAQNGGSLTRAYDTFSASSFQPDAVLFASQSAELRDNGMFREDSTGVAYGPVSHVTGDLPRLPPSGAEARPVELFLKASRGDFDQLPDTAIDDISARVFYRPSWLHVPGT